MIPTLAELQRDSNGLSRVRIAPSIDVPLTPRVRRLLDTATLRRLGSLSQLGLVSLVYPGATHTRLEHSLGVYSAALTLLKQLRGSFATNDAPARCDLNDDVAAEAFLVAALVHDAGHWPFCHAIEDMGAVGTRSLRHEERVEALLRDGPLAEALRDDWRCGAEDVMAILCPKTIGQRIESGVCGLSVPTATFYASCLSGPIDVDKLDYLQRDSLHAGVPYGSHFDPARLLASMRPHPTEPKIALGEKGRTAAEMMVFGRYVMFSEVYWHHTVRSGTAMLQRALFELATQRGEDWSDWSDQSDAKWIRSLRRVSGASDVSGVESLVEGLFGPTRRLYKRVAEFNVESNPTVHTRLARRPFWWLVACTIPLAESLSKLLGVPVAPTDVLIDAPPVKLEVDINLDIVRRDGSVVSLGDVSPVASVLANRQFDNHVKRVRIFVPAQLRDQLRERVRLDAVDLASPLLAAADLTESQWT